MHTRSKNVMFQYFLCFCLVATQFLGDAYGLPAIVDPEVRAHLEAKVMAEMPLRDLEAMVESDERVMNAPKSKLIIIPKAKNVGASDDEREAIIIHRKPNKSFRQEETPEYRYPENYDMDRSFRRSSYEPRFGYDSAFRNDEEDFFSPLFRISDLESAGSSPVRQFYESIVDRVMKKRDFGLDKDPFALLEIAGSENVPQYKPRFDYDAYSQDSAETKLQGKNYWKDAPERRDETVDENGCRTVVKKVVDPEDEKKSSSDNAKTVVITKECEYPNLNGPDAKITQAAPLREAASRYDPQASSGYTSYDDDQASYEKSRPGELDFKATEARDPLAPDYIDTMLDKHFKSFPGFSNPLSSFRGYQDRFKLRVPEGFKEVKPTVDVHSYEYSNPKSGFEEERQSQGSKDSSARESSAEGAPKTFEHHYHYDYPPKAEKRDYEREHDYPRKAEKRDYEREHDYPRKAEKRDYEREHDYPRNTEKRDYEGEQERKPEAKSGDGKEPKMMKKSFAYYRKDNPKTDPNDQQYAEEYAQGNYRSFSSSYDSEKDGPKKQQKNRE